MNLEQALLTFPSECSNENFAVHTYEMMAEPYTGLGYGLMELPRCPRTEQVMTLEKLA